MSKFTKEKVLPYLVGGLVSLILFGYPAYLAGYFDPIPYQDVTVRTVEREGSEVVFVADFVKRECAFVKLGVIGIGFSGASPPLVWRDIQGRPEGSENRLAGRQTIQIAIDVGEDAYDELEIKTRHDCNGFIVDRVFAIVEAPE